MTVWSKASSETARILRRRREGRVRGGGLMAAAPAPVDGDVCLQAGVDDCGTVSGVSLPVRAARREEGDDAGRAPGDFDDSEAEAAGASAGGASDDGDGDSDGGGGDDDFPLRACRVAPAVVEVSEEAVAAVDVAGVVSA